jgi:hypothetical protein
MDSPEGAGLARRAWHAYAKGLHKVGAPVIDPFAAGLARKWLGEMIGFWVLWHVYGGFDGLERMGMHKTTIWRKVKKFRMMFKEHPDTYRFDGIELDLDLIWNTAPRTDDAETE